MRDRFAAALTSVASMLGAAAHSALPATDDGTRCIAPVSYFALHRAAAGAAAANRDDADATPGSYERISPDGRFVLRSYSGRRLGEVSLIELPLGPDGPLRAFPSPLSNEAFPLQGSWRYLVDVNGDHYRFRDVLLQGKAARPLFRGGMTGFYAAAAEMAAQSGAAAAEVTIRSLSWPQTSGVEAGGAQGNVDPGGSGPLQIRTLRVQDDGRSARVVQDSGAQYVCNSRGLADGNVYGLPMISIDGREFSAVPQAPRTGSPTMRVYGLSAEPFAQEHACDQRIDLGHTPAKAVFGYPGRPVPGQAALLAYTDNSSVYFFDRSIGQSGLEFRIDDFKTGVLASAFPGLTRDGRLVFGATWSDCAGAACRPRAGYVVADPYQSRAYRAYWAGRGRAPAKACITQSDVERERAAFAAAHNLPER